MQLMPGTGISRTAAISVTMVVLGITRLGAQPESEIERTLSAPPSERISLEFGIGATVTGSSGPFPSLLFVAAEDSTGVAPSSAAATGIASRWSLTLYVPISGPFGGVLEGGSRVWSIRYGETGTSRAVRMDLQTSMVALMGRLTVIEPEYMVSDGTTFHSGLDAGIEFGFGPYRNLVETSVPADSAGSVLVPVEGSFQGGDPFRGQTGLVGRLWGGLLFSENLDVLLGIGYVHPFAPLFSDKAVRGNDARISQYWFDIRVGWKF